MQGDAASLHRLAVILLDNAIKYAGTGGAVTLRLAAAGSQAVLTVHNTGTPIPPDRLPHIFERFYRADPSHTGSGTGLGLAIAQSICQAHHAAIRAESGQDGMTFRVEIRKSKVNTMEIERKWMVQGWPQGLPLLETYCMDQGYISVRPTVRIRREALQGGRTALVLCFKGAPDKTGLMREEIETEITPELFEKLERLIGKPLIAKERRTYALKNGLKLEVNDVDAGLPSHFMYAEVEYPDEPTARAWTPADDALTHYLSNECTGQPGASMGEYWTETRK